jgi:phosphonate transport system substrate-binding protein
LIEAILAGGEENLKYEGMQFLPGVEDRDYDYVRSMYETIGFPEYAEFVGD